MDGLDTDVVVIGGGPAGAALAAMLAPSCRVVLVDRGPRRRVGLGETLPGAAGRLLRTLGVWPEFLAQRHPSCHARLSRWGSPELLVQDGLRDLDGAGWSLDRPAFDGLLRDAAVRRGARLVTGRAALEQHGPSGWTIDIDTAGHRDAGHRDAGRVRAPILVDATGRGSRLLRLAGQRIEVADRLVSVSTLLPLRRAAQGTSYVQSAPDGWWWTGPAPGGHRVVAFHTDPQLVDVTDLVETLPRRIVASPHVLEQADDSDAALGSPPQVCAAGSGRLHRVHGADWLAVGDAAVALDPLSSQGLFNALHTGVTSAPVVLRALAGEVGALEEVQRATEPVWAAYRATVAHVYAAEQRWADRPFWRARRHRALSMP